MTGQAEVMSAGCTLNNAVQKSGSGKSLGRVVGIALRSEAAALWFDAEVIIHGPLNSLFAAEIPFGGPHGNVAQKELNLLQFTICGMAQLCARAAKIMWSDPRKTEFLRVLFRRVPDQLLRYSITPMLACSTDASKQPSRRNPGRLDPHKYPQKVGKKMNLPRVPVEVRFLSKDVSRLRLAGAIVVLVLFTSPAVEAQFCKANVKVGCLNSGAACSPVQSGTGTSGHCETPSGFPKKERICECVGAPTSPPPLLDPRCGDRTATGTFTCTINQPNVTQLETAYPVVEFAPGDVVEVNANGCVQTGGHGQTWKRYVNPAGDHSDHLYHGLIRIPTGTKNGQLVRIQSVISNAFTVTGVGVPVSELVLYLGYEDDAYQDNGYDHHDNGAGDQCKTDPLKSFDGGPAHVTITITRGKDSQGNNLQAPTPSSTFDFDVLWTQTDPNGLPYNPQWSWQLNPRNVGITPHWPQTSTCHNFSYQPNFWGIPLGPKVPDLADCTDQADQSTVDLPQGTNKGLCNVGGILTGSDSFAGHVNWFPVTIEGTAESIALTALLPYPFGDDDYTFPFLSDDQTDGLDANSVDYVHVEFDSDETVDNFKSKDWTRLRNAVEEVDTDTTRQIFKGHTILTGMFGLDGEHDLKSELHPLFAIATKPDWESGDPSDERWLIFVRNQGDEGYCSNQVWNAGFEDYTFRLPWLPGMTSVDVDRTKTQFKFGGTASGPVVSQLPPPVAPPGVPGVFVTFHLGPAVPRKTGFGGSPDATFPFVDGTLYLIWSNASQPPYGQPVGAEGANQRIGASDHPAQKTVIEGGPTGKVNEAEDRIAAAVSKLTPAQQLQVKNARAQATGPPAESHDGGPIGPVITLKQAPPIPQLGEFRAIPGGPASRKLERDAAQMRALCAASNNKPAGLPRSVCKTK